LPEYIPDVQGPACYADRISAAFSHGDFHEEAEARAARKVHKAGPDCLHQLREGLDQRPRDDAAHRSAAKVLR